MPQSPDARNVVDGLFDFSKGMDRGVSPLIIPRDQAFNLDNATVRGTFAKDRPKYRRITLDYLSSSSLQSAIEGGIYQGGCFYNPDTGNGSLMASISGRLFQFSILENTATIYERTITGDLNQTGQSQAWLWQSENFVIVNDGLHLPIFFDGTTSRRSFGDSTTIATVNANFTIPAIGSVVSVSLPSNYTGPFNVPIKVDDATYQAIGNAAASYNVVLTNYTDSPGTTIPTGTSIFYRPAVLGAVLNPRNTQSPGTYPARTFGMSVDLTLASTPTSVPPPPKCCVFYTLNKAPYQGHDFFTTFGVNNPPYRLDFTNHDTLVYDGTGPAFGDLLVLTGNTQPNVLIGKTTAPFVVPALGSSVTIQLDTPFNGTPNQQLYIGDKQYTAVAGAPPPPGTTLNLLNIDDENNGTTHTTRGPTGNAGPGVLGTVPELPVGRMGTYGLGRNWMSLADGRSFIGSDIVGGSSGTQAYSFRDAPLKITENNFLAGGGVFPLPGSVGDIRAMRFAATLDASLGQGALEVYTPTTVFSCNAPVDRTKWQDLTNPILTESLISNGGQGQNSTVIANGDTFFRSTDGLRSLILARREFNTWGNVPISIEVDPVISLDEKSLLPYGTAAVFENRLLMGISPAQSQRGIYFPRSVIMNFDPLATLRVKLPAVYDGFWSGLNVLQYHVGLFNGVLRCFAFVVTADLKIALYEILQDGLNTDDDGVPVSWSIQSASLFKDIKGKGPFDYMELTDGEVYVDEIVGTVDFRAYYKPDQSPDWIPWHSWRVTDKTYFPRMGLGKPDPGDCNVPLQTPTREFYTMQFRLDITGHCRFLGAKFKGVMSPQPYFAKPVCVAIPDGA